MKRKIIEFLRNLDKRWQTMSDSERKIAVAVMVVVTVVLGYFIFVYPVQARISTLQAKAQRYEKDYHTIASYSTAQKTNTNSVPVDLSISIESAIDKVAKDYGITVNKMVKSGVIKKFSPVIDHEKLGFVLTTIIGVRVKGGKLKNWEEKTFFNKNVVGIYDVTGEYDAFLIAKFRNTNELNAFIKELLKDPIIERTYTQTVLDVIKEDMGSSNIL